MLIPFLIMLREGLEAALIVGIIATYLRQTGRGAWMPLVWIGIFLAVSLALLAGAGLQFVSAEFPQRQQELFEALVGFVAVAMLTCTAQGHKFRTTEHRQIRRGLGGVAPS